MRQSGAKTKLETLIQLTEEDVKGHVFHYGKGCDNCNNTGYRGRLGIFEIMTLDDDMRDMIVKHASTQQLRAEIAVAEERQRNAVARRERAELFWSLQFSPGVEKEAWNFGPKGFTTRSTELVPAFHISAGTA